MSQAYSTQDAFDIYVYYLALKRHFTSSYDFFKYNGKVKANAMSFENRKDKFFFYKLSKRKDAKELILANLVLKPNAWAGDLLEEEAVEIYQQWSKRKQSFTYTFKSELNELDEDFNSNFIVEDGQHPRLLKLYNMRRISLETLCVLCEVTGCLKYWDKTISDTIVYPDINKLVKKYSPFLDYDKPKLKQITLDKFN